MKKNVNVVLLFLLLLVCGAFVAFTIYYKETFVDLQTKYVNEVNLHKEARAELQMLKGELNETLETVEVKADREQDLTSRYSNLKGDKQQLELNYAQTAKELSDTKILLAEAQSEVTTKETTIVGLELQITKLQDEISDLQEEIEDLEDELDECEP